MPVPISLPDTLNLIKLLTGGKAKLTLTVGVEYGSGIRLGGELRSGGSNDTLYGSFINPARPSEAAGTLVTLNPRQHVLCPQRARQYPPSGREALGAGQALRPPGRRAW
jgi:hypothetical protein